LSRATFKRDAFARDALPRDEIPRDDLGWRCDGDKSEMKPCCGLSLIFTFVPRRATTVVLNPRQLETDLYNQIAVAEINNVAKNIVKSASISLSPRPAALFLGSLRSY
jgi:hypothetical protein